MVANDLCIKAKNRYGSVKQLSFQWFWCVQGYTAFLHVESRVRFIMIDDTTVKLLSLKRQKIGLIFETPKNRYDTH